MEYIEEAWLTILTQLHSPQIRAQAALDATGLSQHIHHPHVARLALGRHQLISAGLFHVRLPIAILPAPLPPRSFQPVAFDRDRSHRRRQVAVVATILLPKYPSSRLTFCNLASRRRSHYLHPHICCSRRRRRRATFSGMSSPCATLFTSLLAYEGVRRLADRRAHRSGGVTTVTATLTGVNI